MGEASEWIKDVVCDSGTVSADCDFCHRVHYVGTGYGMDEGELEGLNKKREAQPDRYVRHDGFDSISIGHIEGNQYVWGCGCKQSEERLKRIENWIWSHQRIITSYMRKRIDDEKAETSMTESLLKSIETEP